MIDRLKNRFYQSGQALLNILEYKIINLKLINNDYIQYINELNNLFEQHKFESNKLKRIPFDEETKLLFAVNELDRIGINSPPIYSYKTFDDLIKELNKRHDFFEKAEILRSKTTVINDSNVNNINKNKPNNNKNYNNTNKIRNEYYCHICKTKGHTTDHCKYNLLIRENNKSDDNDKNYKNNNYKNKNYYKRYNNKNNYYSGNIINKNNDKSNNNNNNFFENNNENENEVYIDFTGNISVIQNCNYTTINNNNSTHWIIDSGTGIILTNNINNLSNINKVNNKNIIYPNGDLEKVENVVTYNGKFKNNDFI